MALETEINYLKSMMLRMANTVISNLKVAFDAYLHFDPDKKYIVKGIKVDKISEETLREIKMERIMPDEKMLNILSNFERYHLKNIYLDENNNVVKIIER